MAFSNDSSGLVIDIPGFGRLHCFHLVLDLNGTIAFDGMLLEGVRERLVHLARVLEVHLVSADSHGNGMMLARELGCAFHRLMPAGEMAQKAELVRSLGSNHVLAIGNGRNDADMLRVARLGIAVLGPEGLAAPALWAADVVAPSIQAALDLFIHPVRLIATLRR